MYKFSITIIIIVVLTSVTFFFDKAQHEENIRLKELKQKMECHVSPVKSAILSTYTWAAILTLDSLDEDINFLEENRNKLLLKKEKCVGKIFFAGYEEISKLEHNLKFLKSIKKFINEFNNGETINYYENNISKKNGWNIDNGIFIKGQNLDNATKFYRILDVFYKTSDNSMDIQ